MNILVIGSTGKTGSRIAGILAQRGYAVRHGSRHAPIPFDWDKPETWAPALDGVASVYVSYFPDLAVPAGGCLFNTFTVKGTWDTLDPGAGSTVELFFHGDAGGFPVSIPFAAATVTSYSETATGVDYFGRPESEVSITFDDVFLEGTVWIKS